MPLSDLNKKIPASPPRPVPVPLEIRNYRKLPVEIKAVKLCEGNMEEVLAWIQSESQEGSVVAPYWLKIETLEGQMTAHVGDWIIRGVKGEFYPCKPDIFAATYEEC